MTELQALAGRTLIVGFSGHEAPPELLQRIGRRAVGGVILFARNVATPEQVATLCASLRARAPSEAPLIVAVDQEGGRVQRLKEPFTVWPPMARLAREDASSAYRVGRALGAELAAAGCTLNFAPVLDVHTNPANPVIGDRSFGSDPHRVAELGLALAKGLEDAGVCPCGKHFPGHGDTAQDSHLDLPSVEHDEARLRQIELAPFERAARAKIPMIMTAHVLFPAFDAERPATLSPRILGLLRNEMGYDGVIVSDDLEMKAVADRWPIEELVVQALRAGCDAFLICHTTELQEKAAEALVRAAEKDPSVRERLREAAARVGQVAKHFGGGDYVPPADLRARIGTKEHRALAQRLGGAS